MHVFNLKSIVSLPNTTPQNEGGSLGALKIPASEVPKGFTGFKIDPAALAEALETIKGIDTKTCPLDYNFVKKGSPSLRKNAYFYLWLAAKQMEKQVKQPFDCRSFADQMKTKAEAANTIAQLESDIRTLVLKNSNPKNGLGQSQYNTLYKNIDISKTLELIYNLDFNDSDKVVVLMALHSLLCSPSPSYGKLFVAFDTNELAVKTLSKFLVHPHIKVSGIDILMGHDLTDPSTAIQEIKEKVFKTNQNSQIKDIYTIYNNSKLNDFRIANALRNRRQYPAAETIYTQQFEAYMNAAQKNMSESEKQEFVTETKQILNKVDEALLKETNPNKMAMLQQRGWTAIYQLNKRKNLESLERYFQNNQITQANNIKFQKAYKAFEAYRDMMDPLDEYFNLADATEDTLKDYTKEITIITLTALASQATAHTGSSLLYSVLAKKSPEVAARLAAMLVGFALNVGTFATIENVISSNPQWNKTHYANMVALFALLGGAGRVGKVLERAVGERLTQMFKVQLEKEYGSKFLNASLDMSIKGLSKSVSVLESAITLMAWQIGSSAELGQKLWHIATSKESGQVRDVLWPIFTSNLMLVMGLKTANTLITKFPKKSNLTPQLKEKHTQLVKQLNDKGLTPEETLAATSELVRLCYGCAQMELPVDPKNLTQLERNQWYKERLEKLNIKIDLQLHASTSKTDAPKLKIPSEIMSAAQKIDIDLEKLTTPKKLNSAFYKAAWKGRFALVKYFIEERGVDPNVKNSKGNPALPMVAGYGYENLVTYLLEHGADVNISNGEGQTALDLAKKYGQTKIVKIITDFQNRPESPPEPAPAPQQTESPVIAIKQINQEIENILGSKSVELESLHFYMIRLTPTQWHEFCQQSNLSQIARESLEHHMGFWEGTDTVDAMRRSHIHFLKDVSQLKPIRLALEKYYKEISSDFTRQEFQNENALTAFAEAASNKFPELNISKRKDPLNQLQDVLETSHFYDIWILKHQHLLKTSDRVELKNLIDQTKGYRNKLFSQLSPHEAQTIKKINRALLELAFPEKCPQKSIETEETEIEKKGMPQIDKNTVLNAHITEDIPLRENGSVDISKLKNNVVYRVAHNKTLNGVSTSVKVVFSDVVLSKFTQGDRAQLVKQINSLARNGFEGDYSENKNGLVYIKTKTDKAAHGDRWTLKVRITSGKRLLGWFLDPNTERKDLIAWIDAFQKHEK